MKKTILIAAVLLATPTLTGAMEKPAQKMSNSEISKKDNVLQNSVDKGHLEGNVLEELVYDLVIQNKIYMELYKHVEPKSFGGFRQLTDDWCQVKKLPQSIEELREWCAKGYPFGKNERVSFDNGGYSTEFYSFWLFHYGVINNSLPLVRYALDQHNNFWNPQRKLKRMLSITVFKEIPTHLSYIVENDFIEIFDFALKNEEFCKFSFGDGLLECYGKGRKPIKNINLIYILKLGSKAMITQFSQDKRLVDICLNVNNINGEGKINPVELAKELGRPQEIVDIIENAIESIKKTTTETEQ